MPQEILNPFNPSFGKIPPVYVEREEEVSLLCGEFENSNSPYQSTMIYGQRGFGKTAFMVALSNEMKKRKDWIVVDIPPHGDMLCACVQNILNQSTGDLRKALSNLKSVNLSVFGAGVGFSFGKNDVNYTIVLENILTEFKKKHKKLLVTIDEVEAGEDLKKFITAYKHLMQNDLPITLLTAGLPQNMNSIRNAKGLTFLLRAQKVEMNSLSLPAVKRKYQLAFKETKRIIDDRAIQMMTRLTMGYAYAFQLIGYLVWKSTSKNITTETVDSVIDDFKTSLYSNAYAAICNGLSDGDKNFLTALSESISEKLAVKMETIAVCMGKDISYISTYRRRLIADGIIRPVSYGYVEFTLPFFDEYVREYLELL